LRIIAILMFIPGISPFSDESKIKWLLFLTLES
jgi:hypothetical protein